MKKCGVNIRITKEEKEEMESKAKEYGFSSLSEYIRFVCLNCQVKVRVDK